ncbi:NADH-ubiquinone oxidoreductase-F iron-sulfur binding region domain-containing protein [Flexivirga alba]|uniref:NADH-ubiquinone oxidoreductase-F iron-sulfur binding region domain-containing protein n=1 Tax=Flexivirga alba TaxID=702742 RepID=A0ABW2AG32_9MICO
MSRSRPLVFGGKYAEGRRLRPTLVLNAETVWRVSQIARNGPRWFRSFGTPTEPGPRLVTIAGAVEHPGVIESAAGTPIAKLLRQASAAPYQAVSVGGLSSGFLSGPEAEQLRWESTVLMSHGCTIGSGVLRVIGAAECPVEYVAHTLEIAAGETAGQCGPCMFGVPAVASDFAAVVAGDAGRVPALRQRLGVLSGRGACHFPDGVAQHIAGALRVFGDDLDAHLAGRCVADHDWRTANAS